MADSNLIPRGTDRIRRRAAQAQAKTLSEAELAGLVSPKTPEKDAALAEARERAVVRQERPPQTIRQAAQAVNAAQAEHEAATIVGIEQSTGPLKGYRQGQQVDHITARQFMKRHGKVAKDQAMASAKAAGAAVLRTLRSGDDQALAAKPTRFRKRAAHAAATAKQKKKG